jgi:serine/threonine-protein kinase
MGVVYEGIQPVIGKRVAVKVLRPELSADTELVERFLSEARAVNAIRHRGIVDIFSFGELPNGSCYFVMELLEGQPFDRLIKDRAPILPYDVMSWVDEVLDALDAVHSTGIIHRDIKPSNLYLVNTGRGRPYVKLLDFGVAKLSGLLGESTPHTKASVLIGTPDYMAPEQARGKTIGPAADIYALGCVIFEMLTGRRLHVGENPMAVIFMHIEEPSLRVSALVKDAPPELDELVASMLEKNPAKRPASAAELRRQVEAVKRILPSDKTSTYTPSPRRASREVNVSVTATPSPSRPRGPSTRIAPPTPAPPPPASLELGPTRIIEAPSPKTKIVSVEPLGVVPSSAAAEEGPTSKALPKVGGSSTRLFAMLAFFGLATGGLTFGYLVVLGRPTKPPIMTAAPAEPAKPPPLEAAKPEPVAVKPTEPAQPEPVAVAKPVEPVKPAEPEKPTAKPAAPAKRHTAAELDARLGQLAARLERKDAQRGSKDRVLHQFLDQAKTQVSGAKSDEDRREAWKFLGELDKQIGP